MLESLLFWFFGDALPDKFPVHFEHSNDETETLAQNLFQSLSLSEYTVFNQLDEMSDSAHHLWNLKKRLDDLLHLLCRLLRFGSVKSSLVKYYSRNAMMFYVNMIFFVSQSFAIPNSISDKRVVRTWLRKNSSPHSRGEKTSSASMSLFFVVFHYSQLE